ncbi:MAG TPA: hypothetical protein VGR93_03915 [Candidatus Acidoferrales bacterium]|nr:hypothetical protein [Candidatus Acidoferrales bacterium]
MASADTQHDPEYVEWRREMECIKQKIAKKGAHDLKRLERAGVPREISLELLALTAARDDAMIQVMRRRRDKLKSLAGRMERIGHDLQEAVNDPLMRMAFWVYYEAFGAILGMKEPKSWTWKDADPGAFLGPSTMRVFAKMFREEAKKFSIFLRRYGRADSRQGVGLLLLRVYLLRIRREGDNLRAGRRFVKLTPKRGPDQLDAVARLLTDAFEAAGVNKSGAPRSASGHVAKQPNEYFSAEGLSQVWRRVGYRMLLIFFKNAGALERVSPGGTNEANEAAAAMSRFGATSGRVPRDEASSDTSSQ